MNNDGEEPVAPIWHMKAIMASQGLRIRPTHRSGNEHKVAHKQCRRTNKKECHSAALPVCVIASVWSFGCWLLIWVRLYRSFTEVSLNDEFTFGTRRDILAARQRQFVYGVNSTETRDTSTISNNAWILERLVDPEISIQVQKKLIADTQYPQLILEAFLEPSLQTDDNGSLKLRTNTPDNLTRVSYPYKKYDKESSIGACSQNGAQWTLPTFHPSNMDYYFEGNVFRKKPLYDKRWELASGIDSTSSGYCPVDADPYLPWLQDVFPSRDGRHVEFIISNKRRCNTDPKVFQSDLNNLEPQVALVSFGLFTALLELLAASILFSAIQMQPIPVKRIKGSTAINSSILWYPAPNNTAMADQSPAEKSYTPPRYILVGSIEDADNDGRHTRFICRFHTVTAQSERERT